MIFIACAPDSQFTGNSSETINGIIIASGKHAITGKTSTFAAVHVFSKDYWPHVEIDSLKHGDDIYVNSQQTGISGKFSFIDLKSGSYNLIVSDSIKSEYCFVCELKVLSDTTIRYVSDSLYKSGSIRGKVQKGIIKDGPAVIFIPCTPYYTETNADGTFILEIVPRGTFSLYLDYVTLPEKKLTHMDKLDHTLVTKEHIIAELGIIEVKSDSVSIYDKSNFPNRISEPKPF